MSETTSTKPELNEGEKLAFSITLPDGKTIHTILLPGDVSKNWNDAMEWAKSIGGDLPDRAEQALFFKYMPEEFQKEWYWSNTQHASISGFAWYQYFNYGYQDSLIKSFEGRARAVRRVKFTPPELKEGEIYAGAIIAPDGTGHHVILLDGDNDDAEWQVQMDWAKSIGGDLPNRVEQALLYAHLKDRFQPDWYWSNTQHASTSVYAWYQYFGRGSQDDYFKSFEGRARAVRRVTI